MKRLYEVSKIHIKPLVTKTTAQVSTYLMPSELVGTLEQCVNFLLSCHKLFLRSMEGSCPDPVSHHFNEKFGEIRKIRNQNDFDTCCEFHEFPCHQLLRYKLKG